MIVATPYIEPPIVGAPMFDNAPPEFRAIWLIAGDAVRLGRLTMLASVAGEAVSDLVEEWTADQLECWPVAPLPPSSLLAYLRQRAEGSC